MLSQKAAAQTVLLQDMHGLSVYNRQRDNAYDKKRTLNMKIYNKLVRDKIPELIESDGKKCVTHILSEKEYIAALETKLDEEVAEYQADKTLEEMADVLEVLRTICIARGYTLEELEQLRAKKAAEKGGFEERIFLEYVE